MKTILLRIALLLALLVPATPALATQDSVCLPTSGTVSGLTIVTGINAGLKSIITSAAGDTAPGIDCSGVPVEGEIWLDTADANGVWKIFDGGDWLPMGVLDSSTGTWTPPIGGGAASLASASTTDLWSIPQNYITITGTTTTVKLAGSDAVVGTIKFVAFAGAMTLTQDATQLVLPGGQSIQTAAGDKAAVVALGGGNVAVINYSKANGRAVVVDQQVPTGHVDQFLLASAPAGWVDANGGTIGDAASSSSLRSNSDTLALFTAMWALDAAVAPILTSGGSASTRGVSAAADFAAHKRITVPDLRGVFLRGYDDGRGVDSGRMLGSLQAAATSVSGVGVSATSSFSGNSMTSSGSFPIVSDGPGLGVSRGISSAVGSQAVNVTGTPSGSVSTSVTLSGAAETRPVNVAVRVCIKL